MSAYVEVENVTLEIPIFDASRSFRTSLKNYITGGQIHEYVTGNKRFVSVRALENINFRLEEGDRLGLIGHNGAGKTSLLRTLAGVYKPLNGFVRTNRKITPLFNASIGLDFDDTGLDNISTIGMYLGMSQKYIASKKDEIIEFSGIGDFIHLPVRSYSTGMLVRLSFAIATAMEPEILLMDEGIGAADAQFSDLAKTRFQTFFNKASILVLASHSDELIHKLCNKAALLEKGRIVAFGDVDEVFKKYHGVK